MMLLDMLAEQRIDEAMKAGEFEGLPGVGLPLPEDDWLHVPEDERIAYRLLKNAGYVPPELELHHEAVALSLLLATQNEKSIETVRLVDRLSRINLCLAEAGKPQLVVPLRYLDRLADRL